MAAPAIYLYGVYIGRMKLSVGARGLQSLAQAETIFFLT
jgi:hypothetical protein